MVKKAHQLFLEQIGGQVVEDSHLMEEDASDLNHSMRLSAEELSVLNSQLTSSLTEKLGG